MTLSDPESEWLLAIFKILFSVFVPVGLELCVHGFRKQARQNKYR